MFNTAMEDIEQTFNTATPIAYGGTGATSAVDARDALGVPVRDSISVVGLVTNDPNLPYMRQISTNDVLLLQRQLNTTSGSGWNRIGAVLIQRGTVVVTTDGNGIGTINLPVSFGSASSYNVVGWNGDVGTGVPIKVDHYRNVDFPTASTFLIRATRGDTGANHVGLVRVDYVATGTA